MTDELTPTSQVPMTPEMMCARIETLNKALIAAADCIDELSRTAVCAQYTINKLYKRWDELEGIDGVVDELIEDD